MFMKIAALFKQESPLVWNRRTCTAYNVTCPGGGEGLRYPSSGWLAGTPVLVGGYPSPGQGHPPSQDYSTPPPPPGQDCSTPHPGQDWCGRTNYVKTLSSRILRNAVTIVHDSSSHLPETLVPVSLTLVSSFRTLSATSANRLFSAAFSSTESCKEVVVSI